MRIRHWYFSKLKVTSPPSLIIPALSSEFVRSLHTGPWFAASMQLSSRSLRVVAALRWRLVRPASSGLCTDQDWSQHCAMNFCLSSLCSEMEIYNSLQVFVIRKRKYIILYKEIYLIERILLFASKRLMTVLRRKKKFIILFKEIYLIWRISFFQSERLMTVLRGTTTFDLHISGNEQ